ncbi:kinase-like domain-containing protein [Ilyonectria robusta]|uniref:kinase-like domain-containing protein n=1 Tax=Ilyonectria robusta TaxID=1079257 RepID=UPI001E8CBF1A|nr:kinase-like domain-containing protein [Ilyonectria robusta]KAH8722295.1 kinase-like domain-containing protein [Ilyonectria robusta]
MGDWVRGWTRVGQADPTHSYNRFWEIERELDEQRTISAWDNDDNWPSINKPLFSGPEAKRFDGKLVKLDDLGYGAFGRVEEVTYGSVRLARKRITRRRGFTIEDLRQESLTMNKLDHRHVVKLVATYAPRPHELCLLIWPAAVCNLSILLEDLESLRLGDGDREDIIERLNALDLKDLSAIEPNTENQGLDCHTKCPLEFLRNVIGCVSRAMAHCHSNDVRHLDIKPSNILLKADRVYLADFGISRDVSGQDQTTTEGLPGTERWRAPELYADHGSSMQLSDVYSLGLVFLNIATVLYNVRLAEFDEALKYLSRQTREEQLRNREDKLKAHLEKMTSHALVTPPFMFTFEGQETVRPRPVVNLISKMITSNPRSRLPVDKIDDKLSMLGGIHQIYHGECCKRPISWVENKWDRKFTALDSLRQENERQKKRIDELEGRDKTYELRLEHERKAHEHTISVLQAKLKEAEEKCRKLESENADHKKSSGRGPARPLPRANRSGGAGSPLSSTGLGLSKTRSTPTTPASRPPLQPSSRSVHRFSIDARSPLAQPQIFAPRPLGDPTTPRGPIDRPSSRSPSFSNLVGYQLRSRGSGSKLPLPVTPGRSETPNLNRDQSLTDSSMASSIFSRQSFETIPTPAQSSPVVGRNSIPLDESKLPQWGQLAERPAPPTERVSTPEQASLPSEPSSPTLSMPLSTVSSPRTLRSDLVSENGDSRRVPALLKSWAEVANDGKKVKDPRVMVRPRAFSNRSHQSHQSHQSNQSSQRVEVMQR